MTSEVYNIDCMEYIRTLPDKAFDLAVVDPPYGLSKSSVQGCGKLKNRILNVGSDKMHRWDVPPDQNYFAELFRVSKHQIIWGGNYFDLPPTRGIICWDKQQPWKNFSQWEMAWTSFSTPAAIFRFSNRVPGKIHPTQKPVELYRWLFQNYLSNRCKILDTHLGSGSSRIAAYELGLDFVGCEIDKEYFDAQENRFKAYKWEKEQQLELCFTSIFGTSTDKEKTV